ncbi:MAG: Hpt domain-containing protein [Planctomycetes bacterium]|nr:Hpt domain-containing protein [Planctomycetota bacterium]
MPEAVNAVQAQLARLREKYGRALPEKISGLEAVCAPVLAGPWEEQASSTAYRQVHSLAGSSGTYGFPDISSVARAAEVLFRECLESRAPLAAAQKSQAESLMLKLREMAAAAARQISA